MFTATRKGNVFWGLVLQGCLFVVGGGDDGGFVCLFVCLLVFFLYCFALY